MALETEHVEYKRQYTDAILKEIIAFANTDGGTVFVGADNDGTPIGLTDADSEFTRVSNGIRDGIVPDITMFVRMTIQENGVLCIAVQEGANKPYYLRAKGLKPSGVYVRQGASSAPSSFEQIRQMIKESDGDNYESMRAMEQDLTFHAAEAAFQKYGIDFDREKFLALGMIGSGGDLYTNLAVILSDQCAHTTKIAVFGDDENTVFKDSREFGGSVFKQMEDAFSYLTLCNRTVATFNGLERVEKSDYPQDALREALLNALVHRDYSFSGSIIINVNDQEMAFISIGGLLPGLTPDDIRSGISQPRNKNLAEVFHRLHLIESYGTGIRKIYTLYAQSPEQPRIEVTEHTLKIVLPNRNAESSNNAASAAHPSALRPQMQKIMQYVWEHGAITEDQIGALLGVKKTRSFTIAKQLRDMGLLTVQGRGEGKRYTAATNFEV